MSAGQPAGSDILDLVQESIFVRDLRGRIVFWNKACEELYGWPREAAVGKCAHDLLKSCHAEPISAIDDHLKATGRWEGEISRTTAAGAEIFVDARWAVRCGVDGQSVDIVESARDITGRKQTFAELQQSEQRYRHLFHNMPMALLHLDASGLIDIFRQLRVEGVTDLTKHIDRNPGFVRQAMEALLIVEVNDLMREMFGGRDADDFIGPVTRFWQTRPDTFRRSLESRYRGETNFQEETTIDTLDGRQIDVLFARARPGPASKSNISLVGMIDITERIRAQEMLAEVQAEFAHAARISMLGELTASIAHEVNQPLAAITTNGEAGLRWLGRDEPNVEEARALLKRTVADARRAADIISRIRAMATLEAPEQAKHSLREVIDEALLFLRHEIHLHDVRVSRDFSAAADTVIADRTQLQQVVVNLAVNAMQAMDETGGQSKEVHIRTSAIDDATLCCSIEDNGPGIGAAHIDHLFESFFTTKEGGMGMGLPISRSIIEAQGGRIWAENIPAGGARISFTLPVAGKTA